MSRLARRLCLFVMLLGAFPTVAGEVEIVFVQFTGVSGGWQIGVTLLHQDTGWDHYADAWRIVDGDDTVFGTRTLLHPHVSEQPFTRSLGDVSIPGSTRMVYVEAHDSVHGWAPLRVEVELGAKNSGNRYEVVR